MKVGFNMVNSSSVNEIIQKQGLEYIQPAFVAYRDSAKPFSKQEIDFFFESINPNWKSAIELLNKDSLRSLRLTPVGVYIGSRQLTKLSGREIPLEIFYQ